MPSNFPFQPVLGIHTSISMSESGDGLIVPATRQNAGRPLMAGLPGGVNEPAGTASAVFTVKLGKLSLARESQLAGAAWIAIDDSASRLTKATWRVRFVISTLCLLRAMNGGSNCGSNRYQPSRGWAALRRYTETTWKKRS